MAAISRRTADTSPVTVRPPDSIADSTLIPLPGMGHRMPPREVWDTVVTAIGEHSSRGPAR
ncbi:hypothetical protein OG948_42715 (plasmid) [Embleya sp. NBC_00888]|uniref:hypothetical protein n=1 Tax=Embleya sp. NBC_00888 TaxID=2975960 RepID=UPI002F909D89|nr:hypothetical protein OG948_42715 [Embleya sp. NBC_00888]